MSHRDGSLNLNRAVCNAAGDAERVEASSAEPENPSLMQGVYLENYVNALEHVKPSLIPRPTFQAHLASIQQQGKPLPTQPLLHILITHTAINHVDLLYAHGVHQNNKSGLFKPPFTLGLEFAGIVLAVHTSHIIDSNSSQRCDFAPGDKIWSSGLGSHAEEIIVPASSCRHLPSPSWGLADIAALGAATIPVSHGALTTIANLQAGETVLVHAAAGGLGVYALQIARAMGARVIGTVGSEHKIKTIEELLRDRRTGRIPEGEGVVNYSREGWEKEVLKVCKQVGKDGVDVVYDTVGLVQKSIRCTAFNGRIVVVGFAGRTGTGAEQVDELEKIAVNRILLKQIKLLGYRFGETSRRLPAETVKMWQGLSKILAREPRVIHPVVYKTYHGLEHVNEGMQALSQRKVYGKAVIEVCNEEKAMQAVRERNSSETAASKAKL